MAVKRKERSDKKRTVATWLDAGSYEQIVRLAYILEMPLKEIGERLAIEGVGSKKMIEKISPYFRRELRIETTLYMGNIDARPVRIKLSGEKKRLYMRFKSNEHERLSSLAFAMDADVAPTTGLLLKNMLASKEALYPFLARYIRKDLDVQRQKQLRMLCRFVDANTPDQHVTFTMLIAHILEQCLDQGKTLKQKVQEYFVE